MKLLKLVLLALFSTLLFCSCSTNGENGGDFTSEDMLIRISEIEIYPQHREQYLSILKEEADASVRKEPGVISIFPMFQKEHPNQIRILEIYADRQAYESHLETPHFKHYKESTKEMVKSLKLVDMRAISGETMPRIFGKIGKKRSGD